MKNSRLNQNKDVQKINPRTARSEGQRPDTRDNLDSRKNEEWEIKGDDITHNRKDTRADKLKKH